MVGLARFSSTREQPGRLQNSLILAGLFDSACAIARGLSGAFNEGGSMPEHGLDNRGVEAGANPGVGYGRFGKMFDRPPATRLPRPALEAVATAMIQEIVGRPITEAENSVENPAIPAGYTYFGQFVDHDI